MIILLLLLSTAQAFEVKELSLEYERFHSSALMLQLPQGEKAKEALSVGAKIQIVGPIHWDFRVHGLTTRSQYRNVGLEFFFGVKTKWIAGGWRHHSLHCLECYWPQFKFPVEDAIPYVKLCLIGDCRK